MSDAGEDFAHVYETFQPRILRYLTNLLGAADAPDVTQEVFAKVDRGLRTFRGESQLSTWVYRIATNAARDKFRSAAFRAGRAHETLPDADDQLADRDTWTGEEPVPVAHRLAREEMQACIRDHIDRLPEAYRTVLVLSDLEELTNPEIAEILDLPLSTVKIRLHRGRTTLRRFLEAGCDFYQDERDGFSCEPKGAPPEEPDVS